MTGARPVTRAVSIAELAVSSDSSDVLAALGLGSCVAVVMVGSRTTGGPVAGLAHVLLPEPTGSAANTPAPARSMPEAVDRLLFELRACGATTGSLRAVLVGGAAMFRPELVQTLDVGRRNVMAAERELEGAGVPVAARATGGAHGRSVRVYVDTGLVLVRTAGGEDHELYQARRAAADIAATPTTARK